MSWQTFSKLCKNTCRFDPAALSSQNAYWLTRQIVVNALVTIGRSARSSRPHPWWTARLQRLKDRKKKVSRKLTPSLKVQNPNKFKKLKEKFKYLRAKLKKQLRRNKRRWSQRVNWTLCASDVSSRRFWSMINNPLRMPKARIPEFKLSTGATCSTTAEKLQALQKTFMNPPKPRAGDTELERHWRNVEQQMEALFSSENIAAASPVMDADITLAEIHAVIHKLQTHKAAGPNDVHNLFLKNLPEKTWEALRLCFIACLREGVMPQIWNSANVVPIPKSGKSLQHPSHFRPISISSCLGRVLERILANRLQYVFFEGIWCAYSSRPQ